MGKVQTNVKFIILKSVLEYQSNRYQTNFIIYIHQYKQRDIKIMKTKIVFLQRNFLNYENLTEVSIYYSFPKTLYSIMILKLRFCVQNFSSFFQN